MIQKVSVIFMLNYYTAAALAKLDTWSEIPIPSHNLNADYYEVRQNLH